jgi:YjjG family noncanonical pyrimidine nucleotidase
MKYKAVLFDNDDTLMDFQTCNRNAIALLLDEYEYFHPDRYDQYEEINLQCWRALEKGEMTQNQVKYKRFERFFEQYAISEDCKEAAERFAVLLGQQSILLPDAEETLRQISQQLPVVIVTNGIAAIQRARFEHSPIKKYATSIVISEEVGIAKPDPEIFRIALSSINVHANEALMVGDGIESDIHGANNAGIDVCWVNPDKKVLPQGLHAEYEIASIKECVEIALQ